jgi:hypothetical protein
MAPPRTVMSDRGLIEISKAAKSTRPQSIQRGNFGAAGGLYL